MKLRYGVVDATIKVAELLSNWLNEISKFVRVRYAMCKDGNHDELRMLGEKKGTFSEDNMNKIMFEFIKVRLADNPNIEIIENNTPMIFDVLCNYGMLAHHGEVKNSQNALMEFQQVYDVKISYLIAGHKHHSSEKDVGVDCEVLNVPSIVGADGYSVKLRKVSNAAAKMFVFEEENGKVAEYTYKLN